MLLKKLAALMALLLTMACLMGAALADFEPLPIDFSAGHRANPANFTETTYEDESISVTMEHVWVGNACFNVARVKIADPSQLRTALAAPFGVKKTNRISTIAHNNNAIVAIGGDYFSDRPSGYVIRQGEVHRTKGDKGKDVLYIDQYGDFHIFLKTETDKMNQLMADGYQPINVFSFGPALIIDGQLQEIPKEYKFNPMGTEPRCAIGQVGPLEYLLVAVDGRDVKAPVGDGTTKPSKGCRVADVAQFMLEQGCVNAYNLDGGNSSLMVFGDSNFSTKSEKAERSVSDIIYFATAVDFGLDGETAK